MPRTFADGRAGQGFVVGKAVVHELASDQGDWNTGCGTLVEGDSIGSARVTETDVDAAFLLKIFLGRIFEDLSIAMRDC